MAHNLDEEKQKEETEETEGTGCGGVLEKKQASKSQRSSFRSLGEGIAGHPMWKQREKEKHIRHVLRRKKKTKKKKLQCRKLDEEMKNEKKKKKKI